MKFIDAAATRDALPFDRLIDALRAMFASGCEVPPRQVHRIENPTGSALTSLIMPAWLPGRFYGVKTVNIAPANAERGLAALHSTYLLHDATTGVPLALIDGDQITARRTAAASALAASMLARDDARHLLVVGAGRIARLLPEAMRAVRAIDRVTVWARSAENAAALASELRESGFDAHVATNLEAAARQADIVSCATLATEPVLHGRWLAPGSHLDLIGSFTPEMREADDDCFHGAGLWVDTLEALTKSGDLIGPMSRGVFGAGDVRGTLTSLCRDPASGPSATPHQRAARMNHTERTVFKSVGSALEDLAAAMLVYEATNRKPRDQPFNAPTMPRPG